MNDHALALLKDTKKYQYYSGVSLPTKVQNMLIRILDDTNIKTENEAITFLQKNGLLIYNPTIRDYSFLSDSRLGYQFNSVAYNHQHPEINKTYERPITAPTKDSKQKKGSNRISIICALKSLIGRK